ncbi:copper chaperone [Pseudolysobacter antarcticus]|jgi:copper chaperone|uniref:Copper chaperone n=1 Tax=Pseudolysobacter antarcticus TaxID=2511995 RepID=A0A411HJL7_9GAMM|nr:heavy-metal-associated domain-containing protein [Pseudolysobacter antarcticus]QBB70729.1 copper chaperone [Pseudolysobacter antarcticus]
MQTEHLTVTGMTCGGCTGKVATALKAINGVKDVDVSLSDSAATVQFDERLTSRAQLKSAVEEAGYGTGESLTAQGQKTKGGCCG